jgi:hypothetical protein
LDGVKGDSPPFPPPAPPPPIPAPAPPPPAIYELLVILISVNTFNAVPPYCAGTLSKAGPAIKGNPSPPLPIMNPLLIK